MCTVSFYHDNSKVIITSNRDEHINRPSAIFPQKVTRGAKTLYYPKDPKAGGTWFAVTQSGDVIVLLNGGAVKHIPNPPYRKSRGLVLLDIIGSDNFLNGWDFINLHQIEPFTLIAFSDNKLFQARWNGVGKSLDQLPTNKSYIWSSSTLYSNKIIANREQWFKEFLNQKKENIYSNDFISFHTNTKNNDTQNGLVIKRDNLILTKNITQCELTKSNFTITHIDLISNKKSTITELLL